MDQETISQLKKQFDTLPKNIQEVIINIDLSEKMQKIVEKNKLMLDKAGLLETETLLVLYGVEPLKQYINNIVKNVGLSESQAIAIAKDTDELIFKNIRESLRKINEQIEEEDKIAEESENDKINDQENVPEKTDLLSSIENPEAIKEKENSVSLSSLKSNSMNPENTETIEKGIEIKLNNLPGITPDSILPTKISIKDRQLEPFHNNTSPVSNIVESKLSKPVIVTKQEITIEEKTKLPEKPIQKVDPYREPIN